MTFRAADAIRDAEIVFGYKTYIDLIRDIFPDARFESTGMTGEIERCRMALAEAAAGKDVAVVSSGDSGLYGMAGLVLQLARDMDSEVDIRIIPGVTAGCSAGAILGAPLMHDTAFISLSDRLTEWGAIEKRLDAAGSSDMVIALYNPRSHGRPDVLERAFDIIRRHRDGNTVVGVARNIGRDDQSHWIADIDSFDFEKVDMFCTVIVGNSNSYAADGKMITPRGYEKRMRS